MRSATPRPECRADAIEVAKPDVVQAFRPANGADLKVRTTSCNVLSLSIEPQSHEPRRPARLRNHFEQVVELGVADGNRRRWHSQPGQNLGHRVRVADDE